MTEKGDSYALAGTDIVIDWRPNSSVGSEDGMYVMVRRVVSFSGRLTIDTNPSEELKMAERSRNPSLEIERFIEALEEGMAMRESIDAINGSKENMTVSLELPRINCIS